MPHTLTRLALITSAALSVVSLPAAAQSNAFAPARTVAWSDHAGPPASARTVAIYRFRPTQAWGIPAEVTLADSAGRLLAYVRMRPGAPRIQLDADLSVAGLTLQGETPAGLLTICLYDPELGAGGSTEGHWWVAGRDGDLVARRVN